MNERELDELEVEADMNIRKLLREFEEVRIEPRPEDLPQIIIPAEEQDA